MAGSVTPSMSPTVISRPGMNVSTSTSPSPPCAASAASSAAGHASGAATLEMPTDEPSRGGLTTAGRGSGQLAAPFDASVHLAVGTPFISRTIFVLILSIAMRDDSAPGPV